MKLHEAVDNLLNAYNRRGPRPGVARRSHIIRFIEAMKQLERVRDQSSVAKRNRVHARLPHRRP